MDRWQDDHDRRARIVGLFAEIERVRRQREAAIAIAGAGDLDPWMQRRADERVPASRKGLDAAIFMALVDESKPPFEDVAEAAGETLKAVEAIWTRISGKPPERREDLPTTICGSETSGCRRPSGHR